MFLILEPGNAPEIVGSLNDVEYDVESEKKFYRIEGVDVVPCDITYDRLYGWFTLTQRKIDITCKQVGKLQKPTYLVNGGE